MPCVLKTRDLTVQYGERRILSGISADFQSGLMTAVIGGNGVGKTTYLKAIAHLTPFRGEISLDDGGKRFFRESEIAYVPQLGDLQTKLTVFEMVLLGLVKHLKWHVRPEQVELVYETLEELGIAQIARQPFQTLSGGQKQLVSMAQSLIGKPRVLLLDEPTSALDLRHQLLVMDLAQRYTAEHDAVTLFAVHDLMLASRYAQRLLVLRKGSVFAYDKADAVLTPALIEQVYGVTAGVVALPQGGRIVLPISPL